MVARHQGSRCARGVRARTAHPGRL
jgi:hypothetical protein